MRSSTPDANLSTLRETNSRPSDHPTTPGDTRRITRHGKYTSRPETRLPLLSRPFSSLSDPPETKTVFSVDGLSLGEWVGELGTRLRCYGVDPEPRGVSTCSESFLFFQTTFTPVLELAKKGVGSFFPSLFFPTPLRSPLTFPPAPPIPRSFPS